MSDDPVRTDMVPLHYDKEIRPNDDKLKLDAINICNQYLQFWLPGEVEITVLLSRPGDNKVSFATSSASKERVLQQMKDTATAVRSSFNLFVKGNRFVK